MMRILSLTLILAVLADCISAASIIRKSGSIQVIRVDADGRVVRQVAAGSWVAMPFGDCISQCGSDDPNKIIAFRNRSISCRSIRNELLSDEACFGLRRPCAYQPCHCGVSYCIPKDCKTQTIGNTIPARVAKAEAECEEELIDFNFDCLGCYSFSSGDSIGEPPSSPADRTCVSWTREKGRTCRSGLPFYRMKSNALTPSLCFEYCTGLGFDFFGLVLDSECRCGASELNQAIWSRANGTKRTHLKLPLPPPRPCAVPMDECPVRVYRFKGHFESGGSIPGKLLKTYAGNSAYIDSIMLGHDSSEDQGEDLTGLPLLPGSLQQGGAQPTHALLETMQVPLSTQVLPNSKLLTSSEIQHLVGFGLSSLEKWNLCWRSSNSRRQVSTFHSSCDGKGQSITVVSLTDGSKVGGYTTASWGSHINYLSSQSAWLFSISGQKVCKYDTVIPQVSTYTNRDYGPTFGRGPTGHVLATGFQTIGFSAECKAGSYKLSSGSCDSLCGKGTDKPGGLQIIDVEVYVAVGR